jgi:hypothetical protein
MRCLGRNWAGIQREAGRTFHTRSRFPGATAILRTCCVNHGGGGCSHRLDIGDECGRAAWGDDFGFFSRLSGLVSVLREPPCSAGLHPCPVPLASVRAGDSLTQARSVPPKHAWGLFASSRCATNNKSPRWDQNQRLSREKRLPTEDPWPLKREESLISFLAVAGYPLRPSFPRHRCCRADRREHGDGLRFSAVCRGLDPRGRRRGDRADHHEGIPAHDELRVFNTLKQNLRSRLVAPNCPGIGGWSLNRPYFPLTRPTSGIPVILPDRARRVCNIQQQISSRGAGPNKYGEKLQGALRISARLAPRSRVTPPTPSAFCNRLPAALKAAAGEISNHGKRSPTPPGSRWAPRPLPAGLSSRPRREKSHHFGRATARSPPN